DRVYLTGLSMGGNGTWYLAYRYPERFAAIAPVCGFVTMRFGAGTAAAVPAEDGEPFAALARRLASVPTWICHGEADPVGPVDRGGGAGGGWRAVRCAGAAARVRADVDLPRRGSPGGAGGAVASRGEGVRGCGRRGRPLRGAVGRGAQRLGPGVRVARLHRLVVRTAPRGEVALTGMARPARRATGRRQAQHGPAVSCPDRRTPRRSDAEGANAPATSPDVGVRRSAGHFF